MKHSIILKAGLSVIAMTLFYAVTATAQFAEVEFSPKRIVANAPESYQNALMDLMKLHSAQFYLNDLLNVQLAKQKSEEATLALLDKQLSMMDVCNQRYFSTVYSEPQTAWDKMKRAYDEKLKNLAIHINASDAAAVAEAQQALQNDQDIFALVDDQEKLLQTLAQRRDAEQAQLEEEQKNGLVVSDTDHAEAFPYWRVAREVLTEVYAMPEKYGKVHGSFDLWVDQKYVYSKDVINRLNTIENLFGVDAHTGFVQSVSKEILEFPKDAVLRTLNYQENMKRYNRLLDSLKKDYAGKYNQAVAEGKISEVLPKLPKPLPPVYEYVRILEDPETAGTIFPEWPEPWAYYLKTNTNRAPNGEMNEFFLPNTIRLRDEVRQWPDSKLDNPLSVYKLKEEERAQQEQNLNTVKTTNEETITVVNDMLSELGLSEKVDINNPEPVQTAMIDLKKKLIGELRSLLEADSKYQKILLSRSLGIQDGEDEEETVQNAEAQLNAMMTDKLRAFKDMSYEDKQQHLADFDDESTEYLIARYFYKVAENDVYLKYAADVETDLDGKALQRSISTNDPNVAIKEQEAQAALSLKMIEEDEKDRQEAYRKVIDPYCLNSGVLFPGSGE